MIKKTLLTVAISATLFSLEVSANDNVRANGATSAATLPSVGHRPVATAHNGKDMEVSGTLITGETLTINKFFITDADGDGEGTDSKEANLTRTIEDVEWGLVKGNTTTALSANADKSLTIPAEAAGGKIQVTFTVRTINGTMPFEAKDKTSIILTSDNSGVTEVGNDNTVSAKLKTVTILVKDTPTDDLNGTTVAGTPIVGKTMEAELECAVDTDCKENDYRFQWEMADASAPTTFNSIASATSRTYTVQGDQQNKLFRVVVTPNPKTTNSEAPAAKAKRR